MTVSKTCPLCHSTPGQGWINQRFTIACPHLRCGVTVVADTRDEAERIWDEHLLTRAESDEECRRDDSHGVADPFEPESPHATRRRQESATTQIIRKHLATEPIEPKSIADWNKEAEAAYDDARTMRRPRAPFFTTAQKLAIDEHIAAEKRRAQTRQEVDEILSARHHRPPLLRRLFDAMCFWNWL
jgi:hypothetical protein